MSKKSSDDKLIDILERARESRRPEDDIGLAARSLTLDDGYRLQLACKKRLARQDDPHVSYRVSMTTRSGLVEAIAVGILPPEAAHQPLEPIFTSLSESNLGTPSRPILRDPGFFVYVEAEVAVLMSKRLEGPNVTAAQARAAVGGLFAGFDMAQIQRDSPYCLAHRVAASCAPIDAQLSALK